MFSFLPVIIFYLNVLLPGVLISTYQPIRYKDIPGKRLVVCGQP
jgi:hypothetical protein